MQTDGTGSGSLGLGGLSLPDEFDDTLSFGTSYSDGGCEAFFNDVDRYDDPKALCETCNDNGERTFTLLVVGTIAFSFFVLLTFWRCVFSKSGVTVKTIQVRTGVLAWLLPNIGIVVCNGNCRYPITDEWLADTIAFMPSSVACAMGLVSGSFAIIISLMVGTPVDDPLVADKGSTGVSSL